MFFYKEVFGIKWPIKVDMPLNKETKDTNIHSKAIKYQNNINFILYQLYSDPGV